MPLMLPLMVLVLLALPTPAGAHAGCDSPFEPCPFADVTLIGGPAPGRVHQPTGLAVAPDGRIAVADMGAHRTLVLAPDGRPVRTLDGDEGLLDVNAVAFDATGRLYTAGQGRIRRYGAGYQLEREITEGLLRGDAATGSQRYAVIRSIAVDADGRLFALADEVILVYGPDGVLERELRRPGGDFSRDGALVARNSGRVLVGNVEAGRIEELRADGTLAATITTLPPEASLLAMAIDRSGRLHVPGARELWVYDPAGTKVGATPHAWEWGQTALAVAADGYLVAARERILRFDSSGAALAPYGDEPGTGLNGPNSVDVTAQGRTVVADGANHRVVAYGPDGAFAGVLADRPGDVPRSVALTADGGVVVAWDSGRMERRAASGQLGASWEVAGSPLLTGVSVDANGTIWVRDRGAVLRFSPAGALLVRLEVGLTSTYAAGNGLDVGPDGNLYAAEPHSIVKLSPDGSRLGRFEAHLAEGVEVLANGAIAVAAQRDVQLLDPSGRMVTSWGDHGTPAGRMHLPWDVAVDGASRLFVADRRGHAVFRFTFRSPGALAPPLSGAATVVAPSGPLRSTRRGRVRARLACEGDASCTGQLRLRSRGLRRGRTLAGRAYRVAAGTRRVLHLRLRAPIRRDLRLRGRIPARLVARSADGAVSRRAVVLARRVR